MNTELGMNDTLEKTGITFWKDTDFSPEKIILRDGRQTILWVEKETKHGILDCAFWEKEDFYDEDYRKQFTANLGEQVENINNSEIYNEVNERQFQKLLPILKTRDHYLELGASFGGVFGRVADYVHDSWAIEPNHKDAQFLQARFPSSHIINSTLEKADLPKGFFNVATAFEVLEHTATPCAFLQKCYDALSPDGRIFLEVPNRYDVLFSTYNVPRYQTFFYHKAHIHYYTPLSLKMMLNQNGFNGEVSSFLMYPFFNHVFWTQNDAPQGSGEKALKLHVPVDKNTVAGKKLFHFWEKCQSEYEKLVESLMLGDCLIFNGSKKLDIEK